MPRSSLILSVLAGLVLLTGLALVLLGTRPPPPRTFQGSVKDLLPDPELVARAGWKVDFQPIADTPEMKAKVDELLNYDDAVFTVYTKGSERLSVYIAYWAPGKMSHRLVAGHTPDVCWVGAGWRIVEAKSMELSAKCGAPIRRTSLAQGDLPGNSEDAEPLEQLLANIGPLMRSQDDGGRTTDGSTRTQSSALSSQPSIVSLPPAEYRVMQLNGQTEHVVFWHLLDGEAKSYGNRGTAPWHAMLTNIFSSSLNQLPEQFFIRISGISEL